MGLDTSHDCWHGPYSAFTRFRTALALAAGYEVKPETHDGFTHDTAQIDWRRIERDNPNCYAGEWNTGEADALIYLIAHSDCDGVLHPAQANALADRLEDLIPRLQDGPYDTLGWITDKAEKFVRGLRQAVERGEDVEFR